MNDKESTVIGLETSKLPFEGLCTNLFNDNISIKHMSYHSNNGHTLTDNWGYIHNTRLINLYSWLPVH